MKKGKIIMTVTIGIACFLLVMIIFMQFKMVHETDITSIDTMRESELRKELASWKSKYEDVEQKYTEVSEKLKSYKEESNNDLETKKKLEDELSELNLILGKTNVVGPGITITIKDGDGDTAKVTAEELLIIVNNLKDAGAEAISVNEKRIVDQSYIVDVSTNFIKANGQRIVPPYVIKAIGNSAYLESALLGNGGYAEELKALGKEVTITSDNKINIPKYDGQMTTKYIEEDE